MFTPQKLLDIAIEYENAGKQGDNPTSDRWKLRQKREDALHCAAHMERNGIAEVEAIGPFQPEDKTFKRGDRVRIRKGAQIRTTHPTKKHKVAAKSYVVTIHTVFDGWVDTQVTDFHHGPKINNPEVSWAGEGGYWHYVGLEYVEKVED